MDLYAEIRKIVSEELAVEEEAVVPEADLQDDLGADSLEFISLAETIGDRYDIDFDDDDLLEIGNVDELVKLIRSRIDSKS